MFLFKRIAAKADDVTLCLRLRFRTPTRTFQFSYIS